MTKKEMINKIEELKLKAFNNQDDNKYSSYLKLKTEVHAHGGCSAKSWLVGVVNHRRNIYAQVVRDVIIAQMCIYVCIHNLE